MRSVSPPTLETGGWRVDGLLGSGPLDPTGVGDGYSCSDDQFLIRRPVIVSNIFTVTSVGNPSDTCEGETQTQGRP